MAEFQNPSRAQLLRMLSDALYHDHTITIHVDSQSGRVFVRIAQTVVARYHDAYEALEEILPEYAKEFME